MFKDIGTLLVASSLLLLFFAAFVDAKYGSNEELTGNVVINLVIQPDVDVSIIDYLTAIMVSYSILSFIMGVIFLFRM